MTDDTLIDAGTEKLIGVGMGGSCPSCRAPIDLGQEFCLECGAPIRFSARQQQRKGARPAARTSNAAPSAPRSFPWLPFGIVLALIVGGIGFALFGAGGNDATTKEPHASTQTALPSISNETPDDTSTNATGSNDLACATGATGTPGTSSPNGATGTSSTTGEQIPQVQSSTPDAMSPNDPNADAFPSATPGSSDAVPSTTPDATNSSSDTGGATSADCATSPNSGSNPTSPLATTPGTPNSPAATPPLTTTPTSPTSTNTTPTTGTTNTTSTSTSTSATTWPQDKDGWTVVVFGYSDQDRANQRAADLQQDGFESGVLDSSDYKSLCPGFYVVFSGVYTTKAQADTQMKRLQGKYQGMYVKRIAKDGSATGCTN